MKKFYAFLMAVLVAAVSFAQGEKGMKVNTLPAPIDFGKNVAVKHAQRKNVKAKVRKAATAVNYVKVNTAPEDWEGQYLIVYEEGSLAMNGGLTDKLDVAKNTVTITIEDEEIASTKTTDAASFTIAKVSGGYSIKSASGLYIGWNNDAKNGLDSNKSTAYVNKLSIDGTGNADIVSECGSYLRYNLTENQERFRYFKAATYTNQQPVALYKLGGEKTEPAGSGEVVVLPDGLEPEEWNMAGTMYVWDDEWVTEDMTAQIAVAIDGSDIYVQGMSYWFEEAWMKGSIEGNKVLFPSNQLMGVDEYGDDIIVAFDSDTDEPTDYLEFDFDSETNTLTMVNYYGESDTPNSDQIFNFCDELTISQNAIAGTEVVEVPEGLELSQYNLKGVALTYEDDEENEGESVPVYTDVAGFAYIGFDGEDVYIQGLCAYLPEAFIKGTRSGNTITLPAGQFYGKYESLFGDYNLFFTGSNANGEMLDVTFTISDDEKVLTAQQWIVTSGAAKEVQAYEILTSAVLTKAVEKVATPANPFISDFMDYNAEEGYGMVVVEIPTTDTDGEPMIIDKLSYIIYVDEDGTISPLTFDATLYEALEENISEVPFTLDDDWDFDVDGEKIWISLNFETTSYTRIGVQSIYRGMGIEHKSDIVWQTIDRSEDGIKQLEDGQWRMDNAVYDLSGRKVGSMNNGQWTMNNGQWKKGIYIVNGKKIVKR